MTREATAPIEVGGKTAEEHVEAGGKLLYQGEDGWAMYDWSGNWRGESFLVHACKTSDNSVREVYIFPDTHKACWRCQAPLPDGMKALWIMHNGVI